MPHGTPSFVARVAAALVLSHSAIGSSIPLRPDAHMWTHGAPFASVESPSVDDQAPADQGLLAIPVSATSATIVTPSGGQSGSGGSSAGSSASKMYDAPKLVIPERKAFGSTVGMANLAPIQPVSQDPASIAWQVLAGLALASVVVTLMVYSHTSRLKRADARSVKAPTMASKYTLLFGATAFLGLVAGSVASRGQYEVLKAQRASARSESLAPVVESAALPAGGLHDELAIIAGVVTAPLNASAAAGSAEAAHVDALVPALARYSGAAAHVSAVASAVSTASINAEANAAAAQMQSTISDFDRAAASIVTRTDELTGVLTTQMDVAIERAIKSISSVHDQLSEQGQDSSRALCVALARTSEKAREALASGQPARLSAVNKLTTELDKRLAKLVAAERTESAQRAIDLARVGLSFWLERYDHACQLQQARGRDLVMAAPLAQKLTQTQTQIVGLLRASAEGGAAAVKMTGLVWNGVLGGVLLALLGVVGFGFVITRRGVARSERVLRFSASLADGDLTRPLLNSHENDEMGEMARTLDRTASLLKDVASELSVSTRDASVAMSEIASASEDVSLSVSNVARQISQTAHQSSDVNKSAASGTTAIEKTVSALQSIHESMAVGQDNISRIAKDHDAVASAIALVHSIAEDINLLAVNAAIEAARAGDQHQGFASIAREVRRLADRATLATTQIESNVGNLRTQSSEALELITHDRFRVHQGVTLAAAAATELTRARDAAQTVDAMIRVIQSAGDDAGAGVSTSAAAVQEVNARLNHVRVTAQRLKLTA